MGIWAAVHGLVALLIADPDVRMPDHDELLDHICDTQLRGLHAENGGNP